MMAGIGTALAYLRTHSDPELEQLWIHFYLLTAPTRFCISIIAVGIVYFGGAMYLNAVDDGQAETAASARATFSTNPGSHPHVKGHTD